MRQARIAARITLGVGVLALASSLASAGDAAPGSAPTPLAAQAPAASTLLDQLLQLLAQRRHGRVSFTEVHQIALLEQPLQSSGELLYEAPDRLEKRTLKPKAEDLLLEHGLLTVQRGNHRRVVSLHDYPQAIPFVESIRATLAGDRAALEHYFTLQLTGTLAGWTLELVPKDPALARTVQRVRIAGEQDAIHTVEIRQGDGDTSLLTLGPEAAP